MPPCSELEIDSLDENAVDGFRDAKISVTFVDIPRCARWVSERSEFQSPSNNLTHLGRLPHEKPQLGEGYKKMEALCRLFMMGQ